MWNSDYITELNNRRARSKAGGGEKRIEKQHSAGKLTARERLDVLFDENTFVEVDSLVESRTTAFNMDKKAVPGDGVVIGYGQINGKLVFAYAEDFTVNGGTLGEYHAKKICCVMDMALSARVPIIAIYDSGGARIEEGIDSLSGYSSMFLRNTKASGVIPQIAVMMGTCAGGACYSPAICDYIFMVENTSKMFITGSRVVKDVISEVTTDQELGGTDVLTSVSGIAHFKYPDDIGCLEAVRDFLEYLPSNNKEEPPVKIGNTVDHSNEIEEIIPDNLRRAYDVHRVIEAFADVGSFWEVQPDYAKNIVVGLVRIDGEVVGIVANQPSVLAGVLDVNASDKAARFIRFCDCFNISLLTLVDTPGYMPGTQQEHAGIIRHGAKVLYAYAEATVPKVGIILRKAFGGAYIAMNSKKMGADLVFSLPIAQIAVMGSEGAVDILYRRELEQEPERWQAYIQEYESHFMNPYIAAARGLIDEVIAPEELKSTISKSLEALKKKSVEMPWKKHGNIPL